MIKGGGCPQTQRSVTGETSKWQVLSQVPALPHGGSPTALGIRVMDGFSRHRWLGPVPRVSDSLSPEWGPSVCISTKFPRGAHGLGMTL